MTIIEDIYDKLENVIGLLGKGFTTFDVVKQFKKTYPKDYAYLVENYREGGAGGGEHYSLRTYIGQSLGRLSTFPDSPIEPPEFIDAPEEINWGNDKIATWKKK